MGKIFISYRRSDSINLSSRIYERLVANFGESNIFMDIGVLKGGMDFQAHLKNALNQSSIMLIIIGPTWIHATSEQGVRRLDDPTDFVRIEIESAIERKILIIPVLLESTPMPTRRSLPESLTKIVDRQATNIKESEFNDDMNALILVLARYVIPLNQQIVGSATQKVTFHLGHQLEKTKYRSQLVTLQRPDTGVAQISLICYECGYSISVQLSSLKQADIELGKKSKSTFSWQLLGLFAIIIFLCTGALNSNGNILFGLFSFLAIISGIIYLGFGILLLPFIPLNLKELERNPAIQKEPRFEMQLSPLIVDDTPPSNRELHRLISEDKRSFLVSETKRGLQDLQIPIEDRL